jgi:hypothetical protein
VKLSARVPLLVFVLACSDRKGFGEDAASSTGDSTEASTGDTTETGEPSSDCEPILQEDRTPSGFELCTQSGDVVRASSQTCTNPYPPSNADSCVYGICTSDDDCQGAAYGACQLFGDFPPSCACVYGCTGDVACGPGFLCMCAPVDEGTICVEADCRTDADCPAGSRCVLQPGSFDEPKRFECQVI